MIRRIGGLALLLVGGFVVFQWLTWPEVAELAKRNPRSTAFIEEYRTSQPGPAPLAWRWVGYDQISDHLKHAVVVAEDIDFFTHSGFAPHELKQALRDTVLDSKPLRGASTLSQQLVKNLWLSPSRNPWRKVKEALLTIQLERRLNKRRILEIYLNVAEFAPGVYGAEAAARGRFDRAAAELTPRQAAELAACLPRPSSCAPGGAGSSYWARVERIAGRVRNAEWVKREL